jgi:methylaspartate mutase epsilon subunit
LPIHRESFGPLTATLVPPAIAVAVQIIEMMLAAEQGVTSFAVSFGQTGSIVQDIATAHVLKRLAREYLEKFAFDLVQSYLVYHQWMGQFPPHRPKAGALIVGSSIIANMISADKIVVKTVDEALGVPSAEVNAEAVETVRYALRIFRCAQAVTSPLIEREIALIDREAREILDTIFDLSGNALWESVFRAFRLGFLDIPFSPHADNANKLISMRDPNGSIRILEKGNVPISRLSASEEAELLKSEGSAEKTYRQLLVDINVMV